MNKKSLFTQTQHDFIVFHIKGLFNQELADLVNKKFGLHITARQIKSYKHNHDLPKSGQTGWYLKGHTPKNKGKKFPNTPHNTGMFEKGHRPATSVELGSECMRADGYVWVKIAEPNKWRQKHVIAWEKANGRKKPAGHVIIFADRDHLNFKLDNLLLVPHREFLKMNQHGLIKNDIDLTKTGLIIAKLHNKIQDLRRK